MEQEDQGPGLKKKGTMAPGLRKSATSKTFGNEPGFMKSTTMVGKQMDQADLAGNQDVINNVEKMLAAEQTSLQQLTKSKQTTGGGMMEFDMNEVIVGGQNKESTIGGASTDLSQSTQQEEGGFDDRFGAGALDEGMGIIKRKTIVVKSENVGEVFMQNIQQISETVQGF